MPLETGAAFSGFALTAQIDSPADLTLSLSNPTGEVASALILVFGDDGELEVVVEPSVQVAGTPVEIRVPGGATADVTSVVTGPDGVDVPLTLEPVSGDAVAEFTPAAAGEYMVSVLEKGIRQRVALGAFSAGSGAAALPGTFTESLATGPDGLADELRLDVDVEVSQAGRFRVSGILATTGGTEVASADAVSDLAVGQQQVRLTIPGSVLYAAGEDGPYDLDLAVMRQDAETGLEVVEELRPAASPTQPYMFEMFRPAAVTAGFASVVQGGFDTVVADVPVTLSEPVTRQVTIDYVSLNPTGEQHAHFPEDFQEATGTLTFAPGETRKTIPVVINGDPQQASDKVAVIAITNPTNAAVADSGEGGVWILTKSRAVIDSPAVGFNWTAGEEVNFAGHVDDPVDGSLPSSVLSWELRLKPCPVGDTCEPQVLQQWEGVDSGSFIAPDQAWPAHLELALSAEGPSGLTHDTVRTLAPSTVAVTLASNPPGRLLGFGYPPGTLITADVTPYTKTVIEGSSITLWAPDQFSEDGVYYFDEWLHGETRQHVISAPSSDTTYTATFTLDPIDGGFETGTPNPFWDEGSTNFGTPVCSRECGNQPRTGNWWAWFGGINTLETGFVRQAVTIEPGTSELRFWLRILQGTMPLR